MMHGSHCSECHFCVANPAHLKTHAILVPHTAYNNKSAYNQNTLIIQTITLCICILVANNRYTQIQKLIKLLVL